MEDAQTRNAKVEDRPERETAEFIEDVLENCGQDLDGVVGRDGIGDAREADVEETNEHLKLRYSRVPHSIFCTPFVILFWMPCVHCEEKHT